MSGGSVGSFFRLALFTVSTCLCVPAASAELTIRLYDYASTDRALLERSIKIATELFAEVGVPVTWEQCRTHPAQRKRSPSCSQIADASVLQLRIHDKDQSKRMNLRAWQLGYALPSDGGFGVVAGVFLHKVRDFSRSQGLDAATMLGHVMAHELGHLLLGSNRHALRGVMRPRWTRRDLHRSQIGALRFSPNQARRMRAQVETRSREGAEALAARLQ